MRWGRQLKAAGLAKKPQSKAKSAAKTTAGQKRKASPPTPHFDTATFLHYEEEAQDLSSLLCSLPEDSGGSSDNFDSLAADLLMGMTMAPAPLAPAPTAPPPRSLEFVPQELLNTILPHMSPQEIINLKKHCQAYDEACIEAQAAEAAIAAVEQVLQQRKDQARQKAEAARFASETLFHETRKLSSFAALASEHHHHCSPRKCHSPKRSPF